MDIDWGFIKVKYKKSYKIFLKFLKKEKPSFGFLTLQNDISAFVCYCNLEAFFDDNKIRIYILPWLEGKSQKKCWIKIEEYWESEKINSRQEAKEKAILKSFEIMEGSL
jgi:hypothetical protein